MSKKILALVWAAAICLVLVLVAMGCSRTSEPTQTPDPTPTPNPKPATTLSTSTDTPPLIIEYEGEEAPTVTVTPAEPPIVVFKTLIDKRNEKQKKMTVNKLENYKNFYSTNDSLQNEIIADERMVESDRRRILICGGVISSCTFEKKMRSGEHLVSFGPGKETYMKGEELSGIKKGDKVIIIYDGTTTPRLVLFLAKIE